MGYYNINKQHKIDKTLGGVIILVGECTYTHTPPLSCTRFQTHMGMTIKSNKATVPEILAHTHTHTPAFVHATGHDDRIHLNCPGWLIEIPVHMTYYYEMSFSLC